MKKTILITALVLICASSFAQQKQKPLRKATIKLELDESQQDLLLFALQNAPLMETETPANRLKVLAATLQAWTKSASEQLGKAFPADTVATKPKEVKK